MKFISTRGADAVSGLEQVARRGLAHDGGLFVPETWPRFDGERSDALRTAPYEKVAAEVFRCFGGGALPELEDLLEKTYADFRHPARAPLVQIGQNEWVLELFHGPTFAFKDFAMRWLSVLTQHILEKNNERMTILCATSGDTGAAAAAAFAGRDNIDLFVLFPEGRVSPMQQMQITTTGTPNVRPIAIDGNFDDCQDLVKQCFNDLPFRERHALNGVNSVNFARVMPQSVYYLSAVLSLGAPGRQPDFVVPSGNAGHVYSGWMARKIGAPVGELTIATNCNNILARCVNTGEYRAGQVEPTTSPSMDVLMASNFERLLFEAFDRDAEAVRAHMEAVKTKGGFTLSGAPLKKLQEAVTADFADENEVAATIRQVYGQSGYVLDPHTAVGVAVARKRGSGSDQPQIILGTAHPGKFAEAVNRAVESELPLPKALAAFHQKQEKFTAMKNNLEGLKTYIKQELG